MSSFIPTVCDQDGTVIIEFPSVVGSRTATFEGVIDVTNLGRIVGLEILDFRRQLDAIVPFPGRPDALPRWSYDDEMDAYYLRLAKEPAGTQRSVVGIALLDGTGCVARLTIPGPV